MAHIFNQFLLDSVQGFGQRNEPKPNLCSRELYGHHLFHNLRNFLI